MAGVELSSIGSKVLVSNTYVILQVSADRPNRDPNFYHGRRTQTCCAIHILSSRRRLPIFFKQLRDPVEVIPEGS